MSHPNIVYSQLPLEKLRESPLNYRRSFNEKKRIELEASVRLSGVRTPLQVRPIKDGRPLMVTDADADLALADWFEISSGHRRSRAARAVGLEEVLTLLVLVEVEVMEVMDQVVAVVAVARQAVLEELVVLE